MDLAVRIGDWLGAAGGSLALVFIVVLAVAIGVLTLFYLASAVVVLERFARVAKSRVSILGFVAISAAWVGYAFFEFTRAERGDVGGASGLREMLFGWGAAGALVAVGTGATRFALTRIRSEALAAGAIAVLGLGTGGLLGGASSPLPAVVGIGSAGLLYAAMAYARRTVGKRLSRALLLGLFAGALFGFWQPEPVALVAMGLLGGLLTAILVGLVPLAAAGIFDLRHSLEWFIAARYLVAQRRQVFISAITAICVAGIAAGVWLIIVVLSVMNGFEKTWRDEILGNRAHFSTHHIAGPFSDYEDVVEAIRGSEGVTGASPFLEAEGMVRSFEGGIFSVKLRGIDPRSVADVSSLEEDLLVGSIEALSLSDDAATAAGDPESRDPGILVGTQLAVALGVGVGDPMLVISPFGGPVTPLGPAPRLMRFEVAGIFQSSFFQYDEIYTYVDLPAAQAFRRSGDVVDGVDARTTDFYRSRVVALGAIERLGDGFYSRDWKEYFPAFFQALKTERVMMFLLLTMIMVVAAFVIVATLIMMIMEKAGDIAILKALGAEDSMIERIFALEGTLIGLAGTAIGVVAGIAVTARLAWIQSLIETITGIDTLPASIYQFSTLPTEVDVLQIAIVAAIAMILSLGATLLPSWQGARLDPAEALRHE